MNKSLRKAEKGLQVLKLERDLDSIELFFRKKLLVFEDDFPLLKGEAKHIFLYDVVSRLVDILEESTGLPRESVFELIFENDRYNRFQKIKELNLS